MKNKKNKKKVLSIVALAASFVLCIGATFGITLAYFGGNSGKVDMTGITLKTGININAAIASDVTGNLAVPGQPIAVTATGTVSAATDNGADAANAVPGLVRAKIVVGGDLGTATIDTTTAQAGTAGGYWVENGDYYYLVTAKDGDVLEPVAVGETAVLAGSLTVDPSYGNTMSGKQLTASVIFEVAQGELYANDGTAVTNLTIEDTTVQAAFTAIAYTETAGE